MREGRATIQKNLHNLEEWAMRKLEVQQKEIQALHLGWINPLWQNQLAWRWLPRKGAGSPGEHRVEPVSSVPRGNKGSPAYWPVLGGVKPAGQRKWLFSSPWHSWDMVWNYVSSLESPGWRHQSARVEKKARKILKGHIRSSWENWLCWAWGREG